MTESRDRVAIIGTSGRFPGAASVRELWQNLVRGRESIHHFDADELIANGVPRELVQNPRYVRARPLLDRPTAFDAEFFGYSAREAERIDPQQRLILECCWEALEQAGYDLERYRGWVGVFAGVNLNTYLLHHLAGDRSRFDQVDGLDLLVASEKDYVATRVAYKLNLTGPAIGVQTACSTGLVAVHQACQALFTGQCDMALAGAASVEFPDRVGYLYQPDGARASDGRCRPFDARAHGTVFGDAVGVVLLKRLQDALDDGDIIHAVLAGSAVNNDGSSKVGYTAPSIDGQARAIALAQAAAEVGPDDISYVEAHGTGTSLGDPIEIAALTKAFRRKTQRRGYCALGSVKSNVGHTNTAAGVVSLIKVVEALRHEQLPATLNVTAPNPRAELDASPFFLNRELRAWPRSESPRRAGVSALGLGGTNAHAIVEEAPLSAPRAAPDERDQLLPLAARTPSALRALAASLGRCLTEHPELRLEDVAFTLQMGRRHFEQRASLVCRTRDEAAARLSDAAFAATPTRAGAARLVFAFTGHGAQYPGMGRALYAAEPVFRAAIDRCAELLHAELRAAVRALLLAAPTAPLDEPGAASMTVAQPAIFIQQYALAELLAERGLVPTSVVGHSVGEIAAACRAGVFTLQRALELVALRGRAMDACSGGGMLSVPLDAADLTPRLPPRLVVAAINAPGLCALSGPEAELQSFAAELAREGVEAKRLQVACAAHSPLMEPVAAQVLALVSGFRLEAPRVPFFSTLSGGLVEAERITSAAYWAEQIVRPVAFSAAIQQLGAAEGSTFLEIGPGRGLCTLIELHDAAWRGRAIPSCPGPRDDEPAERTLLRALGALWERGVAPDWESLGARGGRRVMLPTYPFERREHCPPPVASTQTPAEGLLPFERWFSVPGLQRLARPTRVALESLAGTSWLLLRPETSPLAARVEHDLLELGARVTTATDAGESSCRWDCGGTPRSGSAALFDGLEERGLEVERVLDLRAYGPPLAPAAVDVAPFAVSRAIELARTLAERPPRERRWFVVTSRASGLLPHQHLPNASDGLDPERTALVGACRAIGHDIVGLTLRVVELEETGDAGAVEPLSTALLAELATADREPSVALAGGARWVPSLQPIELPPAASSRLVRGGVYVITGGWSGIGRELALHLGRRHAARLILIGRSPLPPRDAAPGDDEGNERRLFVDALEREGIEVVAVRADVADRDALAAALREGARRFGRIDGAFHAAGVPGQGLIAHKTDAAIAAVLAPKIAGTRHLCELLAELGAPFLVTFSSTLSLVGAPGQVDYAAANQFLAGFARAERAEPLEVITIHWDIWEKVGIGARQGLVAPEALSEGPPPRPRAAHPLFDRREATPDGERFVRELRLASDWTLSEHRLFADGLLPGAAIASFCVAAALARCPGAAGELRQLELLAPCRVRGSERAELHVTISRRTGSAGSDAIAVHRRSAEGEELIARAELAAPSACERRLDLAALREGAAPTHARRIFQAVNDSGVVRWGPRWDCLEQLWLDADQALGALALDRRHHDDVRDWPAHPALLDVALAIATSWGDAGVYLPVRYRRLRISGPIGPHLFSHVVRRVAATATDLACDVTLTDATGRVVAEIEGYELTFRPAPPRAPRLRGIEPGLGLDAIERVLGHAGFRDIVVSPRDLGPALRRPAPLRLADEPASERAEAAGGRARGRACSADIAERVTAIWHAVLGMSAPRPGLTFFELGGHSLLALELQARLVSISGVQVPLRELFKSPTLEALIARVTSVEPLAGGPETRALPRAEERLSYPLTPAQRRLFFMQQLEPQATRYNVPAALRIRGPVSSDRLRHALARLVERHESLRTTYELEGDLPVQRVHAGAPVELDERPVQATELAARVADCILAFDLGMAPLLRATALRIAADDVVLVVDVHHIAADGLSMAALGRELVALLSGEPLAPLATRYRDYVQWLEGRRDAGERRIQREMWSSVLAGELPVLDLPLDAARPLEPRWVAGTLDFEVDARRTRALRRLALEQSVTPYMLLLASFAVLLGRYSGQEDLIIGTPTAGRRHPAVADVLGMFVSTLPLRCRPRVEQRFVDFLAEVAATTIEAFELQDYPFEDLASDLALPRDVNHNPLFDVFFSLLDRDPRRVPATDSSGRLRFEAWAPPARHAKFDLSLQVLESPEVLACGLEYRRELFAPPTIERLRDAWLTLLDSILAEPEERVGRLEMAPQYDREQQARARAQTRSEFPSGTLLDLFHARRDRDDALAVSDDRQRLSYAELDRRSSELAAALVDRGVERGQIVAVLLERSVALSVALWAIWKAGAAYLPIDPRYPDERLSFLLADSGARLLVVDDRSRGRLDGLENLPRRLEIDAPNALPATARASTQARAPRPEDVAYVIYTSGSTGKPKGVLVEHGALVNRLWWMQKRSPIGPGDVLLQKTPYTFDVSVWELFWWCIGGAALHFLEPGAERDPDRVARTIERERVTVVHFVPSMLGAFLEYVERAESAPMLARLAVVFASGEALTEEHALAFNRLLRPAGTRLVNLYGPTEATIDVSHYEVPALDVPRIIPIGRAIDNIELLVVGAGGRLQPIGVPGELWIAGVGLARGYLNRPELEAAKFVPHPLCDGERAYATGDKARLLPNGDIEFLGRLDFQIKLRGHRIEVGEVEATMRELDGVREAVVLLSTRGAHATLCGHYEAASVPEARMREHLLRRLPEYMVPAFLRRHDALPLNPSGKLDRRALPEPDAVLDRGARIEPEGDRERLIAEVWREVLPVARFGVTDNFFELGGDSIQAIVLVSRLRQRGLALAVADLFRAPTVRALAQRASAAATNGADAGGAAAGVEYRPFCLVTARDRIKLEARFPGAALVDAHPLLPAHEQVLAQNLLASRKGIAVDRHDFAICGPLDLDALAQAWQLVQQRHDVLRSSFLWRGVSEPLLVVHRAASGLERLDARSLGESGGLEAERAWVARERERLRPDRPPLCRLLVTRVDSERHRCVLVAQNSLFDGWSFGVVERDLLSAYAALSLGEPWREETVTPFGAFVAHVRTRDEAAARSFWRARLSALSLASAPASRAPSPRISSESAASSGPAAFQAAEHRFSLGASTARRWTERAAQLGISVGVIAHAVWALSVAPGELPGDVLIGSVSSGRPAELPGIESLVGLLANVLPIRVAVPQDGSVRDWLARVATSLLEARQHEHTDLRRIAEWAELDAASLQRTLRTRSLVCLNLDARGGPTERASATPSSAARLDRIGPGQALHIERSRSDAHLDVPLRAYVTPSDEVAWRLSFDRSSITTGEIRALARRITVISEALPRTERLAALLRPEREPREEYER